MADLPVFSPSTTTVVTAGSENAASNAKRGLFGRRKKSSSNLNSPSTSTLSSQTGSQHSADSAETARKRPAAKNPFKRRSKNEMGSSTGSVDETEGRNQGDSRSLDSYDSDPEPTSWGGSQDGGRLSATPTQESVAESTKLKRPGFFGRRSTSPLAPARSTTFAVGETMPAVPALPKENAARAAEASEARPATSGGELSRASEDRGRRNIRSSTVTAGGAREASDAPPVPPVPATSAGAQDDRRKGSRDVPAIDTTPGSPHTTVTPPTPTDAAARTFAAKSPVGAVVGGTHGGPRHGRSSSLQSNKPSKLSQSMTAPPTPTTSDAELPSSGALSPSQPNSGFFSSMFSAAQNAATSVTNVIPNLGNNAAGSRSRTGTQDSAEKIEGPTARPGDVAAAGPGAGTHDDEKRDAAREAAVKTLGMGELSLGSLGIQMNPEESTYYDPDGTALDGGASTPGTEGPRSAAGGPDRAGDLGLGLTTSGTSARTPLAEDAAFLGSRAAGDATPDGGSTMDQDDDWDGDVKRTDSIKSTESPAVRRQRGSSAVSAQPSLPVPRPTGFAVASKKRNRDFHNLFRSVPEDDYLIEDYGCALQKDILLQGRMYVSEGHITFYSNIFGWITTLVISFDEVVSVEKKSTAMLFPNAIVIQTLHARHVFASFIARDSTYDLIVGIWKVGQPQLVQTPGESHVNAEELVSGESAEEDEDEYEDTEDDLGESFTDAGDATFEDDRKDELSPSKAPSRKPSQALSTAGGEAKDGGAAGGGDFPGPATHGPTSCGDDGDHYDKPLCDETIPAPLGRVYSLLFGPASYTFLNSFLSETEKVLELSIPNNGEWTEEGGKKTRSYTYIKPLAGGIGPKQTRCNITETIEFNNLEDHVTVVVGIQTPDVPSGNVFVVKARYCLMWAENNETRMVCNCTIEWSGKSWIKGPIEKGASDGQNASNKSLLETLRKEVAPKRVAATPRGPKGKGKKRGKGRGAEASPVGRAPAKAVEAEKSTASASSWGPLSPLEPILGPIVDILKPLLGGSVGSVLIGVLVFILLVSQIRSWRSSPTPAPRGQLGAQQWEDVWRKEEANLWEWLEDRVGLDGIPEYAVAGRRKGAEKIVGPRYAAAAIKDQQVDEAIIVMEERLDALKRIVERRKSGGKPRASSPTGEGSKEL